MRIAIDAQELTGKPTGVGRYLANLVRFWLQMRGNEEFHLYYSGELNTEFEQHDRLKKHKLVSGLLEQNIYKQQVSLPKALSVDKPDVLFAPAYTMPLFWKGPSVLTVHDLSFQQHPEWFSFQHGLRLRWHVRLSAARANKILTVSRFSRDQLIKHFQLPQNKIEVIYHGIDQSFADVPFTPEAELRARLNFNGPFTLMVGTLFERRFPMEVIGAFKHLDDLPLGLVIAGDDRRKNKSDLKAEIGAMGLQNKVFWMQYCSERDLLGLYRAAHHLIYLSAYEGFGLPPLEAMSFGLPVILSKRGALKEVYDDCALFIEREDERAVAMNIRWLISDAEMRKDLQFNGLNLVKELTMKKCAGKTLNQILKVGEANIGQR